MQFLGFGNGSDGIATLSGTDAPIDSSCSGTALATTLSATNASFAAGQIILIHQSRGTGVGKWEVNRIASYVAGTITLAFPLVNTYTDSGASQAQVLVLKQYRQVTITGALAAKAWDGNVGGILSFLCSGNVIVTSAISAAAKGFPGGAGGESQAQGFAGEGSAGATVQQSTANGTGGGGGKANAGSNSGASGGGGGYATAGTIGGQTIGTAGAAGGTDGDTGISEAHFGGGGGGGGIDQGGPAGDGGTGGGFIYICAAGTVSGAGGVSASGSQGTSGNGFAPGGSGAGGTLFIKANKITATNIIASGGATLAGTYGNGGAGGDGRVRLEGCLVTSTSTPTAPTSTGGHSWCGSAAAMI